MDAVMDIAARAVSFNTLIQSVLLRSTITKNDHSSFPDDPVSKRIELVYNSFFFERFSRLMEVAREYEYQYSRPGESVKVEEEPALEKMPSFLKKAMTPDMKEEDRKNDLDARIEELVWVSSKVPDKDDRILAKKYVLKICFKFVRWVMNQEALIEKVGPDGVFAAPAKWRDAISELLYADKDKRIALASALEYLPIHIVLAMGGGKYEAGQQRILQCWPGTQQHNNGYLTVIEREFSEITITSMLNEQEKKLQAEFINDSENFLRKQKVDDDTHPGTDYNTIIIALLSGWMLLKTWLLRRGAPLSFEYVFNDELDEISSSRKLRREEQHLSGNNNDKADLPAGNAENSNDNDAIPAGNPSIPHPGIYNHCDPFIRAKNMKLCALSLSGGGIRSATFNLGLLQGFAKGGIIPEVDYLSTVSGGGYIGSWLATWIKREGSLKKVTDRLDVSKSPNPMGEEVRPVRWLRMFSNYFNPDKGLMSVDTWTVGVTWLRNTILNQVIIFSALFAILIGTRLMWQLWLAKFWSRPLPELVVYIFAGILLVLTAILTGSGMQWYLGKQTKLPLRLHDNSNRITTGILSMAFIGSFIISAVLYAHIVNISFPEKLAILQGAGYCMFGVLLYVAIIGQYQRCLLVFYPNNFLAWGSIFITAAIATGIGLVALTLVWKVFEMMKDMLDVRMVQPDALAYSIGPALVLLVFGITVVARMAFLGKHFPDERREWWGRMGAIINKWAFIWMVVAVATLVIHDMLGPFMKTLKAPVSVGGWMALVGATVKAAFSSKTSGKEKKTGFQAIGLNLLSSAGPYIFILGLLIFIPQLIDPLLKKNIFPGFVNLHIAYKLLILGGGFGIVGLYLSWKLGVNEFSMHHFYRNRLVRAYLGATQRNHARQKTANPFTNFDKNDDAKLAKFTSNQGYYGPYPVLNCALNVTQIADLSRQDRKAESFIFSPLYCGFDFSRVRSSANPRAKSYDYGLRPTNQYAYPGGPAIGTAMAISGAAVNPNQGYHSSAGTAFLLTVFNAQMGWWIGNPRRDKWMKSDPRHGLGYIFKNLSGQSTTQNKFVCLSDGGHFDNMGLYEMVRRQCSFIIVSDAEQDDQFTCEGFANAIRCCRIDLGAEIDIDISGIINRTANHSTGHYAFGKIRYSGEVTASGTLLYIKSSITGDEAVDITEYASHNETFPHQTTADQFFDEQQFESYRKLGMHIAEKILENKK